MDRKRIAILGIYGIPASYGGFETFAEELAIRLVAKGFEVTVFCEKPSGSGNIDNYKGVRLVYVSSVKLGNLSTILYDLKCLIMARRDFDVVYMLGYGASIFCFIPRLYGATVWINMDGLEWARSKWSRIGRIYLRIMECIALVCANRIIADAKAIYLNLKNRYFRLPPCSVIPYGATVVEGMPDADVLSRFGLDVYGYFIIVCRLEPENHVEEILAGYLRSGSRCPLVIIGNVDSQTPYVRRLVGCASDSVRFLGTIYDKSILVPLRYYSKIYFHGHSVGGTNPSLLEAMACSNAIIAHDNPFNKEVSECSALYFSNSSELSHQIERLENDRVTWSALRDSARERVRSKYNWDLMVDEYVKII
jgi:glycosyltransferase involved in cell wall biosynthesis